MRFIRTVDKVTEIIFVENHCRTPEEVGLIKVDVSVINLGKEKCM
jgi:hypothetical protein